MFLLSTVLALGLAAAPATKVDPQKKFVLDVVHTAVALPQADPQDRLRVLATASQITASVDPRLSRQLTREGMQVESRILASGEQPAVSLLGSGQADCAAAQQFVESLPAKSLRNAEQSLVGAVTMCPKQTLAAAQRKLQDASASHILAPRASAAVMEQSGLKSAWSQQEFETLFSSLPADADPYRADAPIVAQVYAETAPAMDKDSARRAGLNLLEWLGKLNEGADRNLAVNVTTEAMKKILGDGYQDALAANISAQQVAKTAGQPGEITPPPEETATVQKTTNDNTSDDSLAEMPASQRAREAAARGFSSGTSGDRNSADRYFDTAFSALDEVWGNRSTQTNAASVVEEVAEAAAQVDPVMALQKAQHLDDPGAQALGMLAVARVVASKSSH